MEDARGIAEAWSLVVAHLGVQIPAERLTTAADALGADPAVAWAEARRQLVAHGAPVDVVRRALFALFGVVTDRDPAVAEQAAPALALLAGAPSLATVAKPQRDLLERVHDGPLQDAIALHLKVRENPAMSEIQRAIAGLVDSLRSVISEGTTRQDITLEAQLAAAARRCTWAHVTIDTRGLPEGLSDEVADLVLRVVQESLANLRHAEARNARVEVRLRGEWLRVHVEDDGAGFDARAALTPRPGHLGLPWLSDAVAACGGQLMVRSAPGLGTRVMADLPLAARPAAHSSLAHSLTA